MITLWGPLLLRGQATSSHAWNVGESWAVPRFLKQEEPKLGGHQGILMQTSILISCLCLFYKRNAYSISNPLAIVAFASVAVI